MNDSDQSEGTDVAATNALAEGAPEGAQPEVVQDAESAPAATDAGEGKPKGVAKRIDELTRNWREAERREAALLEMLRKQQQVEPPKAEHEKLRTLADFEYDETKYQAHLIGEATRQATAAAKRELQEQAQRDAEARRARSFNERETKFAENADDYFSVTRSPSLRISAAMSEAIQESDDGPALAYHLAKNPDLADKIADLSPLAAARELGRLEAKLTREREKPPVVSKAPPPVPKIEAVEPAIERDPDKMSTKDWMTWREKQLRKAQGR